MGNLLVGCFDDEHTAVLAAAALLRMHNELSLNGPDVAVVNRREDGEVSVREAIEIATGTGNHEAFWRTLVGSLLRSSRNTPDDASARLSSIGVDSEFTTHLAGTFRPGTSAVMVLVTECALDRNIGVLQGFKAHIEKTPLVGEDRRRWLERLSGAPGADRADEDNRDR